MSASNNKEEFLVPTVREVQQLFAELLSRGEDIVWDLSSQNDEVLKSKLLQFKDDNNRWDDSDKHANMFKSIWNTRKYTNGQVLASLFFVMIVENIRDSKLAEQSRSWHLYPVFRCRRCVDKTGQSSSTDCCMMYVTHNTSCENWKTFLILPTFRSGVMVTPHRGVYKLIDGQVELESHFVEQQSYRFLPQEPSITPQSLLKAAKTPIKSEETKQKEKRLGIRVLYSPSFFSCERMLSFLLSFDNKQQACDVKDLSDSLILFTHNVNNFNLALEMIKADNPRSILINRLRSDFLKISEEFKRLQGTVDLIRSANGVPTKQNLETIFKSTKKKPKKVTKKPENPNDIPVDCPETTTTKANAEIIQLEDFGTFLKEHVFSLESFEDLIAKMSEHFEPEMSRLILQLAQTFLETAREEMCQQIKFFFSTEFVIYHIILYITKHFSNLDYKEVEEQSSDILRHVRYCFASWNPNSRPEFLKKCDKCVGYYDLNKRM
ncbi:uncharacterized protein LOC108096439 [Drosophila ficusphila]|uniref:uncharacterized protein LOC108096439 n=1 Tax=Drosophila ficusphila TaxID=30025 RepID=UPI0007E7EBBC|nr:uncharacterized protein LOC108096439 [Drosophila ficusphila]